MGCLHAHKLPTESQRNTTDVSRHLRFYILIDVPPIWGRSAPITQRKKLGEASVAADGAGRRAYTQIKPEEGTQGAGK